MAYYPILVNKWNLLPGDYIPDGLAEPAIPFSAPPGSEKRLMQRTAGKAAVRLFTQAALDRMGLVGISGYRSYRRQKELYQDALKRKSHSFRGTRPSIRPTEWKRSAGFAMWA